jgi:hypothetical protein
MFNLGQRVALEIDTPLHERGDRGTVVGINPHMLGMYRSISVEFDGDSYITTFSIGCAPLAAVEDGS